MEPISIIIPCFNQGAFIDDAVDSVLKQTFQDFEIIIINDGSTDPFTISKLAAFNKPKTKVIHTENHGLSAARNTGIRASSGKYIQFLDADDAISVNKFELQVDLLRRASNNALCYTDYFTSTETDLTRLYKGRYKSPVFKSDQYLEELINRWEITLSIPVHCFLFNSSLFKENSLYFDETLKNHEDWDCWMNIFALHPEVYYIDQKLAIYRIRENAMCFDKKAMKMGYLKAINNQCHKYKNTNKFYFLLVRKKIIVELKYFISSFASIILPLFYIKKP